MKMELIGEGSEFEIKSDDIKIAGAVFYPPEINERCPLLCICHGIPGPNRDPSDPGYHLVARRFALEKFITCVFNFRGTGASGGNLDLKGWARDLDAVISYLCGLEKIDGSRIYLMGFSAGAATAVYVTAHDRRVAALVSCACPAEFSSLRMEYLLKQCRELGTIRDPDFPPSFEEWCSHFFEISPVRWIDKISPRPLLIIHGDQDELIGVEQAKRLFNQAQDPKKLVIVPGGGHRLRTEEAALAAALSWLKSLTV